VDVFVDDLNVGAVNEYSAVYELQKTWVSPLLSAGQHTVRLVHKTGSMINLDAITVWAPPYTTPAAISNLVATTGAADGSVDLTWTAVGEDGLIGTASSYQLRYSASAITTQALWDAATPVTVGVPAPSVAGSNETMAVTGLTPGAKYFFAVRAVNAEAAIGGLSNSPSALAKTPTLGAGTWDDTNSAWIFEGNWKNNTIASAFGGSYRYSNTAGNAATVVIDSATTFKLVYAATSTLGKVDVYVDGVKVDTIDQYSATYVAQKTWTVTLPTAGVHIIRFVPVTTTMVDIDAIQIP
jgi:hypothetical protein